MMHLIVYVALILLNPIDAKSQSSFGISKLGAERNQYEGVIDMDSLMDTHYPGPQMNPLPNEASNEPSAEMKCKPQVKSNSRTRNFESIPLPGSGAAEPVSGSVWIPPRHIETKFSSTEMVPTGIPGVSLEPNTIPPVLRKLFLEHGNLTKRGFLSNVHFFSNLHKSREAHKTKEKPASPLTDHSVALGNGDNVLAPKITPPLLQNLEDPKAPHIAPLGKRFAGQQKKSEKQPAIIKNREVQVRESRKAQEQEKRKWEEWHSIENPKTIVQKRDGSSRRMKISDFWNKPRKDTSHEEAIKIVLPLILSEMKDPRDPKKPMLLIAPKPYVAARMQNSVNATTPKSLEISPMKTFRIKTDDGKEISFSASFNVIHQLLGLLTKPDSTLVVEKLNGSKSTHEMKTASPITKKTSSEAKLEPKCQNSACCMESTDVIEMQEIETDVLERVLQVDIPVRTNPTAGSFSDDEDYDI